MELTDSEILAEIGHAPELATDAEQTYVDECLVLAKALSKGGEDTLYVTWLYGPISDGNLPSKQERTWCMERNLIVRVVVNGDDGYNACTMRGQLVLRMAMARRGKTLKMPLPQ